MSVTNALAKNYSVFHKTLLFFMRLAWRSRVTLPYMVMIGIMMLDIRLTLEVIIDIEHQIPDRIGTQRENDSDSDQESENQQLGQ